MLWLGGGNAPPKNYKKTVGGLSGSQLDYYNLYYAYNYYNKDC